MGNAAAGQGLRGAHRRADHVQTLATAGLAQSIVHARRRAAGRCHDASPCPPDDVEAVALPEGAQALLRQNLARCLANPRVRGGRCAR